MDWLLLAVLGIIWAVLLMPRRSRGGARPTPGDFSVFTQQRRVLMPRADERFLGPRDRARSRMLERRRRVLTLLLEGIGLTALIGFVPPLREMWVVSGFLVLLLAAYVWMLLQLKVRRTEITLPAEPQVPAMVEPEFDVVAGADRPIVVIPDDVAAARRVGAAG
jgi:hypothetical protein